MLDIDPKDIERFEKYLDKQDNGCWLWTGNVRIGGYGRFYYKGKSISSHRMAWMIEHGDIPEGMCICHKCDVRNCCNAKEHMFLGTHKDNAQDCIKKGRFVNSMLGLHHKEESKKKISLTQMGNTKRLGIKHTEESCKKMSLSQKDRIISEETRKKMSITRKGLKPSEEARKNMSLAQMGNKHNLGKKASKESCEKRSVFMKEYWKNKKLIEVSHDRT